MIEQAKEFGAEIEHKEVIDVNFNDKIKEIKTSDGNTYQAKAVIIATGAQPRKLGCKGELEYTGKVFLIALLAMQTFLKEWKYFV